MFCFCFVYTTIILFTILRVFKFSIFMLLLLKDHVSLSNLWNCNLQHHIVISKLHHLRSCCVKLVKGYRYFNCYPCTSKIKVSSSLFWPIFSCNHVVTFKRFMFVLSCCMCCILTLALTSHVTTASDCCFVILFPI